MIQCEIIIDFLKQKFDENKIERADSFLSCIDKFVNHPDTNFSNCLKGGLDLTSQYSTIWHLEWIRSVKFLRDSPSPIFPSVLPANYKASLHDIKIQSRGPDDLVFDKNPLIRNKIARGNTVLEMNKSGTIEYDLVIYGLRKFTGGMGDEDDIDRNSGTWRKYFLNELSETKRVLCLQKANGESAHMSCRYIDEEFVIFAGSKNVHVAFKTRDDIEKYSDERYLYAKVISHTILNHLEKLDTDLKNIFLSFLCATKFTVIFEILQPTNQHVEDLSYLKEPLLKFITFADSKIVEKPKTLCAIPPDCAIEIAKFFNFDCVKYCHIEFEEVENYIVKIRKNYGYEGEVLYFLDAEDNVFGILKKKTTWYIILRALREKVRNFLSKNSDKNVGSLINKIKGRLVSIKNWIGFTEEDLAKWEKLSIEFANWFDRGAKKGFISKEDIGCQFPVIWNKFLKETNNSDKVGIEIEPDFKEDIKKEFEENENDEEADDSQLNNEQQT